MKEPSLRELARQYASGTLQLTEYRRARTELIQSLLDADETMPPLTQANYTAPIADDETRTETLTATARTLSSARITRELPPETAPQSIRLGRDWRLPAAVGAIIVLLLLVLIMMLLMSGDERAEEVATAESRQLADTVSATGPADPDNEATALLREFTASPRWDQESLDRFVEQWQALPSGQRQSALETAAARRLADLMNQQLLEERALRGDDHEMLRIFEQRALDFAAELGLQDRRLRSSEN